MFLEQPFKRGTYFFWLRMGKGNGSDDGSSKNSLTIFLERAKKKLVSMSLDRLKMKVYKNQFEGNWKMRSITMFQLRAGHYRPVNASRPDGGARTLRNRE